MAEAAYTEAIRLTAEDDTAGGVASAEARVRGMSGRLSAAARIPITIIDRATAPLRGILGLLGDVAKNAISFALGQALFELPGKLMEAAHAAADTVAAQVQLRRSLENTGASWSQYGDRLEAVAEDSRTLGFSDNAARESLSMLLAQTGSATAAQERFTLAMDLARGTGMDLVSASRLLGKVNEDNTRVLQRYGISVRQGATEEEVLASVRQRFSGQAAAFANTAAGQFAALQEQLAEFQRSVGTMILPVLDRLARFVNTVLVPTMQSYLIPALADVGARVGEIADRFGPEVGAALTSAWADFQPVLRWIWQVALPGLGRQFLDFVGWIQTRLLPRLRDLWDWLSPRLRPVLEWLFNTGWPALREAMGHVYDFIEGWLLPKLGELADWLQPKLSGAITWWQTEASPRLQGAWLGITTFLGDPSDDSSMLGKFRLLREWVWDKLSGAVADAENGFPRLLGALQPLQPVVDALAAGLQHIRDALGGARPEWDALVALFGGQGPGMPMADLAWSWDALGRAAHDFGDALNFAGIALKNLIDIFFGPEAISGMGKDFNAFRELFKLWAAEWQTYAGWAKGLADNLATVAHWARQAMLAVAGLTEVMAAAKEGDATRLGVALATYLPQLTEGLPNITSDTSARVAPVAPPTATPTPSPTPRAFPPGPAYQPVNHRQGGGWLTEPILGVGMDSRRLYSFVENRRPEFVVPNHALSAPSGSGGGAPTTVSLHVYSGAVQISGAAGPTQGWADAADGLWADLNWRLRHALANRTQGDGRSAWSTE